MTDTALLNVVAARLADNPPPDGIAVLVIAAFQGAGAVDAALHGGGDAATTLSVDGQTAAAEPAAYLTAIDVEGFRGIGEQVTLAIDPGPGLTLVVGRNGSGKSSFSEALEMLLLGSNQRWQERTKVWQEGWQNLHHRHTHITARFAVDGRRQPLEITRRWADAGALEASTLLVDAKPGTIETLGWRRALAAYPPLLSHHELESALDAGPSKLYDALAGILGLGELTAAQDTLRQARLDLERKTKIARDSAGNLRTLLEQTEDERAATVLRALKPKRWDVDTVERTVTGAGSSDEQTVLRRLRDLATLPVLEYEQLNAAIDELRAATRAVQQQKDSDASRAHETSALLQQALEVHRHPETGETCPVCGTEKVLTYQWRLRTIARIDELRTEAADIEAARLRLTSATRIAQRLVTSPPAVLRDAAGLGVNVSEAKREWEHWSKAPPGDDGAIALATHLETHGPQLITAIAGVRRAADAELRRRERSWRPAAEAIIEWLPLGKAARDGEPAIERLKAAEAWLRQAHDAIRDQRFRPIADAVQRNWTELRQDSNVHLGELQLTGASTQRRLTLDVRVDGEAASALGVMSQGELNCLALSLFLPRASMPESPFRFVVIDDPVQAMDPAKVEALATTLARAAEQRQVIVLTHDTRLPDAVRFLGLPATILEVVRRESSVVELRRVQDPVQRYVDDAFAVAKTEGLPAEAVRVIPGFCRMALESACALAATRRLLHQGKRFDEVQRTLQRPATLLMWLALALLDDADRAGDVIAFLRREQRWAVDAVMECNRGTHGARPSGDLVGFIRTVERLTRVIAPSPAANG